MVDWFSRILLSPIALIYGLVISTRNALYESNILKATSFDLPVISIGSIKVGGTGKTPVVEWLIQTLAPYLEIAVLSRGYGRKTKGYRHLSGNETTKEVGDEALQIKRKFPMVAVAVSESRTIGVSSLLMDRPSTQVIVLDDAFQHRSIEPSISIVMTEYSDPYFDDFLMPVGKLREWRSAISRGNILIVSKCPEDLSVSDAEEFRSKVEDIANENVYFSATIYGTCYSMSNYHNRMNPENFDAVLLVSAVAEPSYLKEHFQEKIEKVYSYDFPDHHHYDKRDINNIINSFKRIPFQKKAFVTTEKDIIKLVEFRDQLIEEGIDIYVQRIGIKILLGQQLEFEQRIRDFLLNFAR